MDGWSLPLGSLRSLVIKCLRNCKKSCAVWSVSQSASQWAVTVHQNRIAAHRFWWCCCCRRSINQLSPLSCPTFSCCCSFCCLSFLGLAEEIAPAFSVAIWAQLVSQSVSHSSLLLLSICLTRRCRNHSTQWEWSDRQRKEGDRGDLSPTLRAAGKANKAKKRTTKNEEEEIARNIRPSLQLRWEEGVAVARRQLEWHKEPVRHYSFIHSVRWRDSMDFVCLVSRSFP